MMAAMIARLEAPNAARSNHTATALFVAMALGPASIRLFEDPGNPATIIRLLVGAIALTVVLLARQQSLLRRATLFIALEAIGGIVAFAYVDVPFVVNHEQQIGGLAVTIYSDLHPSR
jgi:hypothetical protein